MNEILPPPPGFDLDEDAAVPAPPPGFVLDGDTASALPAASAPARSAPDSALAGALDTLTFGLADELGAGIEWLPNQIPGIGDGRTYDQSLAKVRAELSGAQADHPWAYTGGQLAGGLTAGIAAAPASISARVGSGLFPRVAAGMSDGAIFGGLYGLGSGEGAGDRGAKAAEGALIGGGLGGAFPLVGAGASRLYEAGRNALNARPIAQRAGSSPEALRLLGEVMEADGSLGPRGAANMARAGNDAMLADAGPNARQVLDAAIQRGGPGAITAREAIEGRAARSADDIQTVLNSTLGDPQGITAARSAIREGSAGARSNAYGAAYDAPIDYASQTGQQLETMLRSRVPGNVLNEANRLLQLNGEQSRQILARVADDGAVTFERLPDVRQIDYITRALNQAAESGDGAGALGGQTTLGRAYQGLSRDLRSTLRDAVPEYGAALETAADPIRRSQAVDLGSRLLSPSMTRDQVGEAVHGMTGPEREALAQGVRSRLDDVMANVTRTVQDGNLDAREAVKAIKDLSSRANREKLATALGPERASTLFDEIDRAAASFDLRASVSENSKTFARQATQERIGNLTQPGPIGRAAQGEPIQASKRVVQMLTGQTPERIRGRENDIYSEIARLLTRQGGAGQSVYDAVGAIGRTDQATQVIKDRIAAALLGPQYAYPGSTLLLGTDR